MTTATLTSKGQITIPAAVRAALGVETGDRVEFVEVAPGRFEFIAATRSVTALKRMFGKPVAAARSVSVEDMNAAIARRGSGGRGRRMTGLDTNVLVRYIMQDDRRQSPIATRCLESLTAASPGFVPLVAAIELYWVLESAYALERPQVIAAFEGLLRAKEIVVEQAALVWKAVRAMQSQGVDFADALVVEAGRAAGAERTVTFDRLAARDCGMTLLT